MAKKRVMKIPKSVMLMCPHCKQKTRAIVSVDMCPQSYECPKCKQNVSTPVAECCVICAYSKTKCPRTLYMTAKAKGLEIRSL